MPESTRTTRAASPRTPARFALVVAVAAIAALVAALFTPLAAQAAPVALTVKVTGPTGSAVPGMTVSLRTYPAGVIAATATTGSSGTLTFASVLADNYTLQFPRTSTSYAQYLGGASDFDDAQFIQLDPGTTANLVANLAASGALSGAVKTTGGSALAGATVALLHEVDGEWVSMRTATTSSTGSYSITGVEPGEYVVKASKSGYATVYSGNAVQVGSAAPVGVLPQKTTKADFRLGTAGKISGVIKGDVGGIVPLAGAKVTAYRYLGTPGAFTGVEAITSTTAGATGAYTLAGLPPGTYTVHFAPPTSVSLGAAFLGRTTSFATATKFELTSGAHATGKSLTLLEAGSISGLFREVGTLTPIADARVTLSGDGDETDSGELLAVTTTDASGAFTFGNLAPGDYTVTFGSFADGDTGDGVTENTGFERRSYPGISVGSGAAVTGINVTTEARVAVEPLPGSEPTIDGVGANLRVGDFLNSSLGFWQSSGYPTSGSYQWLRDGEPIPGATIHNYQVQPGDLGRTLSLRVDRFDWALGSGLYVTPATPVVEASTTSLGADTAPTIQGTSEVGQVLTVDFGKWTASGALAGNDIDPGILWTDITWQVSPDQSTWTDVATGMTHVVTHSDLLGGPYLRVLLDGTRYGFPDIVDRTTLSRYLVEGTYTNLKAPTVKKSATLLTANPGVWSPTPEVIAYEWNVYDPATSTSTTHTGPTLLRSIAGTKYVTLTVNVSGAGMITGSGIVSAQTGPQHTASGALTISGTPRVGETLGAVAPTWTPTPDTSAYKWQYLSGSTWRTISGATSSTYLVPASLKGKRLRVVMTVTTAGYVSTTKISAATGAVTTGLAPAPTVAPSAWGIVGINNTVSVDPGTWSPVATSFSYVWRSRTTVAGAPAIITGATGSSYAISGSLANKYLEVVITAKRSGHASGSYVLEFGQIVGGTHKNTVKPTVSHLGSGLYEVATNGTWTPSATSFDHAWFVTLPDDSTGIYGTGTSFDSSVSALYRPVDLRVTAMSGGYDDGVAWVPVKNGSFQLNSSTTVTGTGQVGQALTVSATQLTNPPNVHTIARQWQWKDGSTWRSITGATGSTYTPTATYLGKEVRVRVTVSATRYTSLVDYSTPITVTLGDTLTPQSGLEPAVNGTHGVGIKLTAAPGTWSAAGAKFTYRWQVADSMGGTYTDISGATASTFTPTSTYFGKFIRLRVTATLPGYGTGVYVNGGTEIVARSLVVKSKPTVTRSGDVLTVSNGTWDVTPTSYTYSWKRWSLDGTGLISIGSGQSYTLGPNDAGHMITVEVLAYRAPIYAAGSSEVVAVLGSKVRPQSAITVTGVPRVGELLQVQTVDWEPIFTGATYQWYRNGKAIPGGVTALYAPGSADVGTTLSVKVTGTAFGHPTYSTTIPLGMIGQATVPSATVAPKVTVTGGMPAQVGDVLTTSTGTWSVSGMTYTYQWYRGGVAIVGATASSYTLNAADLGHEVWVEVTASKKGYSSATALSQSLTVLLGDPVAESGPLSISVTSGVAKPNTITWAKPVTVSYMWSARPDSASSWTTVSSATTFSTVGLPAGTEVQLVIFATRPGHYQATLFSNTLVF